MNPITLGNPNLFVKGMVEAIVTDFTTGNIIGYDNVASESAVTSSVNMGEITGGIGNPLVINIPDTTRINGTLTSQAFSLEQRALTSGGKLSYNGVSSVCETIEATSTSISVTKTPAKAYGQPASDTKAWCYVREHGTSTYVGTNYGVDISTKVVDFTAVSGKKYDVFYFVENASAQVLALPTNFVPKVATVKLKYGVYARQNNSVSNGTLQGYLYFVVPRAQFTGDVGISASQTSNSTTAYDWTAIAPDNSMMSCADCGSDAADYAYYVYVPCADVLSAVEGLVVIGGDMTVPEGVPTTIPVKYLMPDGSTVQPDYNDLTYSLSPGTFGEVTNGKITMSGTDSDSESVTITLSRTGLPTLTASLIVHIA